MTSTDELPKASPPFGLLKWFINAATLTLFLCLRMEKRAWNCLEVIQKEVNELDFVLFFRSKATFDFYLISKSFNNAKAKPSGLRKFQQCGIIKGIS